MMKKINKLFGNRVAKNAGWLIGGKIIQMSINLIVGLLTARYLGPSNYGLIHYAGAYISFFSSICTLGINSVIVKEFVDNPGKEGMIIGTSLGLRVISSFFSALSIIGLTMMVDSGEPVTQLVVVVSTFGMIFQMFEIFNYWFQSKLQSKITAMVTLVAYVVTSIYRIILLITHKPIEYFAFATSVDYICLAILLSIFYKKNGGGKINFSKEYGNNLFISSSLFR